MAPADGTTPPPPADPAAAAAIRQRKAQIKVLLKSPAAGAADATAFPAVHAAQVKSVAGAAHPHDHRRVETARACPGHGLGAFEGEAIEGHSAPTAKILSSQHECR